MIATPPTTLQTRGCNINICSPSILLLVIFSGIFFTRSTENNRCLGSICILDAWTISHHFHSNRCIRTKIEEHWTKMSRWLLSAHFRYEICIPSFRAIWSPLFHHWTRQSWMVSSGLKRVLLVLLVPVLVLLVLVLVLLVLVLLILVLVLVLFVLVLVLIVLVLALLVLDWGEGWDHFITVLHHLSTGEHLLDTAVPQKCTKGPTNWSSLCFALFLLENGVNITLLSNHIFSKTATNWIEKNVF